MAGTGAAPKSKATRQNRATPSRGDWQHAPGVGWQHGDMPDPPSGLMPEAIEAWETWMGAWYAAFWSPEDLPALRSMVRLYDQCVLGEYQRHPELRLNMDTWGITPKGQQDRRWMPPRELEEVERPKQPSRKRGHIKAVK